VRDREVQRRVLVEVATAAQGWDARVAGVVDSGLPGAKGNREFVIQLVHAVRPGFPLNSTAGSTMPRLGAPRRHARCTRNLDAAVERLRVLAASTGVELALDEQGEADAHADIAVALGGDGTMLRALTRFLGRGAAVIASTSVVSASRLDPGPELEQGLAARVRRRLQRRAATDARGRRRGRATQRPQRRRRRQRSPGRIVELPTRSTRELGTQPATA